MQKALLLFCFTFFSANVLIYAEDNILFSVGDTKVKTSEFEYIYKKNNFTNKADYSRKSLEDYLNLYVNFRLKVKEAISQGLDTNDRFKEELAMYEKQLLDSYVDKDILEKLVKQEFERSKTDVNISHIFFPSSGKESEADALAKAMETSVKLKSGTSFEEAAKISGDKQSADKGGNVGWFNSYQMSFPEMEAAVYSMKVGEVSAPVKTRAGFHILKLNATRPARPRIKVAIIKRFFPLADTSESAKKITEDSIRTAYAQLKSNMPFEQAVERYSEDELSKTNKGQLDWFGINTYAKVFEETAYALKDGEYSAPFKTSTAWYIIKRIETAKALSYEESVPVLKAKLPALPIYQYEMDKFIQKVSDQFAAKQYSSNIKLFKDKLVTLAQKAPFTYKDTAAANVLLQIGNKTFNENDFGKKIQETFYTVYPKAGVDKNDALIKNTIQIFTTEYYKNDIKQNNPEYKSLMDEYRNGIMIFSLSEKNIWNKASEDSTGLSAFFKAHASDFNLKKRATIRTITATTSKQATSIYKILLENKTISDEALEEKIKALKISGYAVNSQILDITKTKLNVTTESLSLPKLVGTKYQITQVLNPLPEKSRALEECRGYVVAAYQEYLEKQWLEELKKKYPVAVNKDVFERLVKK